MNCINYQEHLALRMYGELDARDKEQLQKHLNSCEDCTAFAIKLEQGLGRLAGHREHELPSSWVGDFSRRFEASERGEVYGTRRTLAKVLAVGLAAGFLLGLACHKVFWGSWQVQKSLPTPATTELAAQASPAFRLSQAPVLAASNKTLDRLQVYLNR